MLELLWGKSWFLTNHGIDSNEATTLLDTRLSELTAVDAARAAKPDSSAQKVFDLSKIFNVLYIHELMSLSFKTVFITVKRLTFMSEVYGPAGFMSAKQPC